MATSRTIHDDICLVDILKVCAKQKDLSEGNRIHADIVRKGLLGKNIFVHTALINLYAKCGGLHKAQFVFDEFPVRSVVSWNALIAGYAHHEHAKDALNFFEQMQNEGLSPNSITFACVLKACHSIRALKTGIDVHVEIARQGLIKTNQVLGNALVALYATCGLLAWAQQIFTELPFRNIVSWTALISGYCENGHSAVAVCCFEQMKREGLCPDAVTFASVLKACGNLGAAEKGQKIHTEIIREEWLGRAHMLGNAVIDMYAKCGALVKAQDVFDKLSVRDVVSWTSLIAGYAHIGQHIRIFELFNNMLRDGIQPNVVTFTVVLNACSYLGLVDAGQTYFEIMSKVDGIIPMSDHQTWMVEHAVEEGPFELAMAVVRQMISSASPSVWSSLLGACRKLGNETLGGLAFQHGLQVCDDLHAFPSLQKDVGICKVERTLKKGWARPNCTYAKESTAASRVSRDPYEPGIGQSWHFTREELLTRTYGCKHLRNEEHFEEHGSRTSNERRTFKESFSLEQFVSCELNCHECQEEIALVSLVKACTQNKDLLKGSRLHADILKCGLLRKNIIVGNTLLNMYVKCDAFVKAWHVFSELTNRNVVSWTTMIEGYCEQGHDEEALKCFEQMKFEGQFPDAVTFGCILKAFDSKAAIEKGQEIHVEIVREGLLEQRTLLGNALVHMYAKCGALIKAQEVFDKLAVRDIVSWTTLIAGFSEHGQCEQALHYFDQMKLVGLFPNAVTFICVLKACGSLRAAEKGEEIHAEILRKGLLEKNNVLGSGLVQMYAKCGSLEKAQSVFDELADQNVISWNILIAGYCHHRKNKEAFDCFEKMKGKGVSPNAVTFTCLLKACGSRRAVKKGDELYMEIFHRGIQQESTLLGNAVVDMYAKGGALERAQQVFAELSIHNLASWTSLIAGYCQHGHCEEALTCFEQMKNEGFFPDAATFTCVLKACGSTGAIEKGEEIYTEIVREGLLGKFTVLGSAVVNMYAKCGALAKAQEIFDKLPGHDAISWTALITGYCEHGQCEKALDCFEQMKYEGISPDTVALSVILRGCANIGAAEVGQEYLETLSSCYGLVPTSQQYSSVVDAFSQGGHFDKAMAVIKGMPSSNRLPVWFALLGACQKWGNVKLARKAFDCAVKLDRRSAVAFVCMSNIYAAAAIQENAAKFQAMTKKMMLQEAEVI